MRRNLFTDLNAHNVVSNMPISVITAITIAIVSVCMRVANPGSYLVPNLKPKYRINDATAAEVNPIHKLCIMNGLRINDHFAPTSFIE